MDFDFAPLIRSAQTALRDGLPDRIDDWNDSNGGGLQQVPSEDVHFGPMPGWAGWRLPAIEVAIPEATVDNFAIAQLVADVKGPAYVTAWLEGPAAESDALYELALGYSKCILDVMLQPGAWGAAVVAERVDCSWPAFNPRPEEREEVGFRVLALHIFHFEDEGARSQ